MSASFTIRLAKEDFKFSVAHFTIFGAKSAEPLHGHNYRLALEVEGEGVDEHGLLADCARLKRACASPERPSPEQADPPEPAATSQAPVAKMGLATRSMTPDQNRLSWSENKLITDSPVAILWIVSAISGATDS